MLRAATIASRGTQLALNDLIGQAAFGQATIYLVKIDDFLCGCFVLSLRQHRDRRVLQLLALGGFKIRVWRDALVDFLFDAAKKSSCTDFSMIGRRGFGKLFPEMRHVACIYGLDLTKIPPRFDTQH